LKKHDDYSLQKNLNLNRMQRQQLRKILCQTWKFDALFDAQMVEPYSVSKVPTYYSRGFRDAWVGFDWSVDEHEGWIHYWG
jgi:hypothetical protein